MLRELSKVEQRHDAVLAVVRDGMRVTEVAEKYGVGPPAGARLVRPQRERGPRGPRRPLASATVHAPAITRGTCSLAVSADCLTFKIRVPVGAGHRDRLRVRCPVADEGLGSRERARCRLRRAYQQSPLVVRQQRLTV